MEVIKKDGRVQELDKEKIRISLLSSSSNTEQILNESDINILVKDIVEKIVQLRTGYGNTSSYEIMGSVIDVLKRDGFDMIVSSYLGYKK